MSTPLGDIGSTITTRSTDENTAQRELKAANQDAKKALSMVANSLDTYEVSFVEKRAYRYDNQNAARPKLSHPMTSLRVSTEGGYSTESGWKSHYDDLLGSLPPEIRGWFQEQMQLSYLARDPDYYAFDATLVITAQTLAWLDDVSAPIPLESDAYARAEDNLMVPYVALLSYVSQGSSILDSGQLLLLDLGPNDPLFDTLFRYHAESLNLMEELKETVKDMGKDPPPPGTSQRLEALLQSSQKQQDEYFRTDKGNDLLILGTTINSLVLTAQSLSLGFGPASLLWMSALTLMGGYTDKSEAGIIGPHMQTMVESLSEGVMGLIAVADTSNKEILNFSLYATLITTTAMALGIEEYGIGTLPPTHPHDQETARTTTLELVFHILLSSGVIHRHYSEIAALNSADEQSKKIIGDSLSLGTLVIVMLSLSDRENISEDFFDSFNDEMNPLLDTLIDAIDNSKNERANDISPYLHQAKIALDSNDHHGFLDACESCLRSLKIDPALLNGELANFHHLGNSVMQAFSLRPEDQAHLTTIQSA